MVLKNEIADKNYGHYNDYNFKSILQKRANGLLKFIGIPYRIRKVLSSEFTTTCPSINRIDFAAEADVENDDVCLILECQTNLPTEDDIKRFFQYVSSLRVFKNSKVELYILCTQKASYSEKKFIINDDCVYKMHMISLKDFRASEIFKNIENKIKNKDIITDADIASLQVIVYTDYDESQLEILSRARKLMERIAEYGNMDINDKRAILYLLDMLSANMLGKDEFNEYMKVSNMLVNPRDRYFKNQGIEEGIEEGKKKGIEEANEKIVKNMLGNGWSVDEIAEGTGLSREFILNAK